MSTLVRPNNEGNQQVQSGLQRAVVTAEPLDHVHPLLRDDPNRACHGHDDDQRDPGG
jgi:hypothetical protein